MKRIFLLVIISAFLFANPARAQVQKPPADRAGSEAESGVSDIQDQKEKDKNRGSKNINIDMLVLYGLYNYVLSTANISYNEEKLVALLSSDLRRSNDFGYGNTPFTDDTVYANSSYYENKIGFTGNYNFSDSWKAIFDLEANNDSRGMFNADVYARQGQVQVYNREEKDKFKVNVKAITKAFEKSSEIYFNIGTAQYVHRLIRVASEDPLKSNVSQINPEIGGEYIWSASNRIRFKTSYLQYDYSRRGDRNDWHFGAETIFDLKMPKDLLFSIGLNFDKNVDEKRSPYAGFKEALKDLFIAGLSYKGMKRMNIESLYRFDIVPFQPEEFYLEQKYISPTYDLPPAEVHHSEIKLDFRANDIISLKGVFVYEKSDNTYNYYPVEGNVLSAVPVPSEFYKAGLDAALNLYKKMVEMTMNYTFSRYEADENITYHPGQSFSNVIKLNMDSFGLEWGHRLIGGVYTEPADDAKMPTAVIGHLGIQIKVFEGFNFYSKIDNLYNNKYNLRKGYPEPGITLTFGLRILI